MMVVADFSPAHAGEEGFRAIRIGARAGAVELAVVDPLHLIPGVNLSRSL
jgi:hypothetical protein